MFKQEERKVIFLFGKKVARAGNSLRAAFESDFSRTARQRMHYGAIHTVSTTFTFNIVENASQRQKNYLITKGVSPFESKSDSFIYSSKRDSVSCKNDYKPR